jgi:hypothetical protein
MRKVVTRDLDIVARIRAAVLQVAVTLVVLAWAPGTVLKAVLLLGFWALLFLPLRRAEAWMYIGVCVFFTGMNASALKQGIFRFQDPDVLGMPVYELFMWGFYLLHTKRLLAGAVPTDRRGLAWGLALAYSAAFGAISDAQLLLIVSGALLLLALFFFHDGMDLAYVGYMVLLGAVVEYTGVNAGQWSYPGDVPGGVPLWFVTMWGGIGLFFRRLILPLVELPDGRGAVRFS